MRYKYVHVDGREGYAEGGWQAIVAALGREEAHALPELDESEFAVEEGVRLKRLFVKESGEEIGTLYDEHYG